MKSILEFNVVEKDEVIKIELKGRLDATNANELMEEIKKYIGTPVKEVVYFVNELEYIASAGLRVIIFSKQKIGRDAKLLLIAPQEAVSDVIKMSGLDNFLEIQDSYEG